MYLCFMCDVNVDAKLIFRRTCQLMHDLLETPERFFDHIKRVTASTAAIVIFGHRAPTLDSFWNKV